MFGLIKVMTTLAWKCESSSVIEEISAAQQAALDYLIVQRLHEESTSGLPIGWVVVNQSKHVDNYSVEYVGMRSGEHCVMTVGLCPIGSAGVDIHAKLLRESFIQACLLKSTEPVRIVDSFLKSVSNPQQVV